jgi:ribonuclease HI
MLKGPSREECEVAIQLKFTTTNNEAEHEAIIAGMNMDQEMGVKNLKVKNDSQVVVEHIKGEYEAQGNKMKRYLAKVKEAMEFFDKIAFTRVPREENSQANALAHIGSTIEEEITAVSHLV